MQRNTLATALLCALALSACQSTDTKQADVKPADSSLLDDRSVIASQTNNEIAQEAVAIVAPPPAPKAMPAGQPPQAEDKIETDAVSANAPVLTRAKSVEARRQAGGIAAPAKAANGYNMPEQALATPMPSIPPEANTEKYAEHEDNPVHRVSEQPVSTFSIDVDTGSYANVRRMLRDGQRPPADSVRAEEMINYFDYGHPGPSSLATPFKVTTELSAAPWNGKRQLLMIGIKGYDVPKTELPPSNLVFLIDTSGSMDEPNKLPLLKQSFAQLVEQLRPQDRVSIVVYAGSAGLVLEPTSGAEKDKILGALDQLQAGGSTNGGQGIELAYTMAKQAYMKHGVNRVILATDGDFNVGITDRKALETMVGDQRKSGIALTTLGFGQGNYNDEMAERLADVGDGNHAYIDTLQEARKVLVEEMQSTLLTIAKDVKIQIEFNPAQVAEYRLIGYENRILRREDFNNDKVDAGDIGAGHEVTALYELTLVGSGAERLPALRYGDDKPVIADAKLGELANLKLRYKRPGEDTSKLIERPILKSEWRAAPSDTLRFASAVAAYADALRGGTHLERWTWKDIAQAARGARGNDPWKQRAEFIELVDAARRVTAGESAPQVGMIAD